MMVRTDADLENVEVCEHPTHKNYQIAKWRIPRIAKRLKESMGRIVVSPPFPSIWGLKDVRLMIGPAGKEAAKGPRSRRQKEAYMNMVTDGPLDGCLKLKVPEGPEVAECKLRFFLEVGHNGEGRRGGPDGKGFVHNFTELSVTGIQKFGDANNEFDWLKQVDTDQSLTVSAEIEDPDLFKD